MTRVRMPKVLRGPRPRRPVMPKGKAPGEPERRHERIQRLVREANWRDAIQAACRLSTLGEDKAVIERAWEAYARPDFLRELGKDPDAAIRAGIEAMRRRFGSC